MIKCSTQGAVQVFAIEGPLLTETAERLLSAVEECPRVGRPQWVVDLAEVPLIDSTGCEALLDTRDAATKVGGAVHLAGLNPLCNDILSATGVGRYFPKFEAVKQAVGHFSR
ncbi:STAS domain protein [Botrimarina colliarenosi]|uniref:STAS domain protein n=1 Tax=Botrimarina colliarenosi TaxID=2528001 RepID=A0A5C6ADN9_9BACT|nr:STAS domain-containing protein [Botrimarina colliarenosi]TWT98084.1 STAS domain protein [Botrimarina colliarenosi]